MKISACIITKNESLIIENCLQSIKNIIDEIIVLDTGSTDNTPEICLRYGKVYFDIWEDDFAKARNKAISYITGDWILFIDSDEIITKETQEKFVLFRERLLQAQDYDIFCFKNVNPTNPNFLHTYFKATIFKNNVGIKFVKKVHEHPGHNNKKLNIIQCEDMVIHHFGTISNTKAERDIPILLESIEKDPLYDYYYLRHLGDSYYIIKDYNKSLKSYLMCYQILDEKQQKDEMENMFFINNILRILRVLIYIKKDYKKGLYYSEKVLELSKKNYEGLYYIGFCNNRLSNAKKSVKIYNDIIKFYNTNDDFINNIYIDLSRAYNKLGNKIKSYHFLCKAHKHCPENYFIKLLLAKYNLSNNDYISAIKIFTSHYAAINLHAYTLDILNDLLSYDLDNNEIDEINLIKLKIKKIF